MSVPVIVATEIPVVNGGVDVHAHRRYLPPVGARVGQIHARQGAQVLCRKNRRKTGFIRAVVNIMVNIGCRCLR